jgi:hypothetical protein
MESTRRSPHPDPPREFEGRGKVAYQIDKTYSWKLQMMRRREEMKKGYELGESDLEFLWVAGSPHLSSVLPF